MSKDTKKFKLLHLLLTSFSPVDIEDIEQASLFVKPRLDILGLCCEDTLQIINL